MSESEKKKGFIEDEFDLEGFKRNALRLKYENFKAKNKNLLRFLSILIVILAFVISYFAYGILNYYIGLWRNKNISEKARELAESQISAPETPGITVSDLPDDAPRTQTPVLESTPEPEPEPTPHLVLPEIEELRLNFSNKDIIGYLTIEGTNINCAVTQAHDNEFYLEHDLYAKKNIAGSVFMDFENNPADLGYNTILYGHNMRNGSMFHNLRYYVDKNYFEAHPRILLKTIHEDTEWEIFSFFRTNVNFNYIQTKFANEDDFFALAKEIKEKSIYDTGVPLEKGDIILSLSTCTNETEDTRFVLSAKLKKSE